MTGPLLRSGNLTAFHPLGAVGNPVYLAAAQLRAAIGRRLGPELADSFAIPQRNEDGDTIDWYAPKPGTVVPWSAASSDERAEAQRQLIETRSRIEELGQAMQRESDAERQVFGRLLAHVTSFPDETHVYLVGGRPVISFWGFVLDRASVGTDPLLNLDLLAAPPAPAQPPRRRVPWWAWALALVALALLGGLLALRGCQPVSEGPSPAETGGALTPEVSEPQPAPEDEVRHLVESDADAEPAIEDTQDAPPADQRILAPADSVTVGPRSGVTALDAAPDGRVPDVEGTAVPLGEPVDKVAGEDDTVVDGEASLPDSGAVPGEGENGSPVAQPAEDAAVDATADDRVADEAVAGQPVDSPETVNPDTATPEEAAAPEAGTPETETPTPEEPSADEVPAESDGVAGAEDALQPPTVPAEDSGQASPDAGPRPDQESAAGSEKTPPDPKAAGDAAADSAPGGPDADGAAGSPSARSGVPARWLSSGWRTATSLQDPKTGLPIQMEYQLKDGAGKVRLKRSDGSVCESGASALARDGKLVIDSSGNIVCADGTNFGRPKVECEPGKTGKASCRGSYPGGETFSIDMQEQGR